MPRSPELPWWDELAAVLGLLFGGFACASAVYGHLLARSATQSRNRLDLLRNLQVGVVQVDREDWILGANDRAEEIFGRELTKFADPTVRPSVNFARLIEPLVWRTAPVPDAQSLFIRSTLQQENAKRLAGEASAYFAQLAETCPTRWIHVSATPMMLVQAAATGVESTRVTTVFASVDEVSEVTRRQLEQLTCSVSSSLLESERQLTERVDDTTVD